LNHGKIENIIGAQFPAMTDTVKKLSAFTICVKFVMALVTLAGGLLLIRLFGEKRIQWILNNVLPKKQIQEQAWSPGACMPAVGTEPSAEEC
jgi:hypothetical protein